MSRSWFQEGKLDNDWRIFHTADEKLSVRRRQFAKSFDEFIKDKEQPKVPRAVSNEDKANNNNSKYSLLERISELDENLVSSSSCDEKDSLRDEDEYKSKSQNEDDDDGSWESTSAGDESDDDQKYVPMSKVSSERFRYTPYRSLTEVLISNYHPETTSESGSNIETEEDNAHLLSLDNKIPVVHALNRLEDINKVLKTGHLTTQMERIIEYKQDHPFDEGYDEDGEVNCCDWVLYRLNKLYNNFCSTQWPN